MNMEQLGYFLFMEEQEKEAAREREEREAAVGEYKVKSNYDLVRDRATYNENLRKK